MVELNAIENNKLIAEFMGFEFVANNSRYRIGFDYYLDDEITATYKFNRSWNWLMPVVEKIETIFLLNNYSVSVVFEQDNLIIITVLFSNNHPEIDKRLKTKQFISKEDSKINAVYNAVINFIKWYNTQNSELNAE